MNTPAGLPFQRSLQRPSSRGALDFEVRADRRTESSGIPAVAAAAPRRLTVRTPPGEHLAVTVALPAGGARTVAP
jgi:hypothetical protein